MAETPQPSCRFAGDDQPRMLRTHDTGCDTAGCRGCKPCPERHCQVCSREHVTVAGRGTDETCAACIGITRDDLTKIGTLAARLLGEAILHGINSEAAMLDGPSADPEAWGYRRMSALAGRIDASWLDDNHDELHPLWVVGTWEQLTRDHLTQPSDARVTLTEARAYLDGHLSRLAHDDDFAFEEMATGLRRCRIHLEAVLHDGEQIETGAPCMSCHVPLRLIRTDSEDRWSCPRCKQESTEAQYRFAVMAEFLEHSDQLTASQIEEKHGIPSSTIRRWASDITRSVGGERKTYPARLRPVGKDSTGRKLYSVERVLALRDDTADGAA